MCHLSKNQVRGRRLPRTYSYGAIEVQKKCSLTSLFVVVFFSTLLEIRTDRKSSDGQTKTMDCSGFNRAASGTLAAGEKQHSGRIDFG